MNNLVKILLLFIIIFTYPNIFAKYTDVRAVLYSALSKYKHPNWRIDPNFIKRVSSAGYTHILLEVSLTMNDWISSKPKYKGEGYHLINALKKALLDADKENLKVILEIQMGSMHSNHWMNAFDLSQSNFNIHSRSNGSTAVCHNFLDDPENIDKNFIKVLKAINEGFNSAVLSGLSYKEMEYLHLGHDEYFTDFSSDKYLLMGYNLIGERKYLKTAMDSGYTINQAVQSLMVYEISHRIKQVQSVFDPDSTGNFPTVMIWGDMWDPEFTGKRSMSVKVYNNSTGYNKMSVQTALAPGIAGVPDPIKTEGITMQNWDPKLVKTKLIVIPWNYKKDDDYNTEIMMTYFKNNDIKFMYACQMPDGPKRNSILPKYLNIVEEFVVYGKKSAYQDYIMGFAAVPFPPANIMDYYTQTVGTYLHWNTIEYLSYWNQITSPKLNLKKIPEKIDENGEIEIPALLVCETEITQGDYLAVLAKHPFNNFRKANLKLPAENITFYDAILFCNAKSKIEKLDTVYTYTSRTFNNENLHCITMQNLKQNKNKNGYRLPSLEEWQYAYRAETSTKYFWGISDTIADSFAWHSGNSGRKGTLLNETKQVGIKKPNKWGLFDMSGNVAEMVWSNDEDKTFIVGGSFNSKPNFLHCEHKEYYPQSSISKSVGFRIVRHLK